MSIKLQHPKALVNIDELQNGKRQVAVSLSNSSKFIPYPSCETKYPVELIELILSVKGPEWLCGEIIRDEEPTYVRNILEKAILGYVDENQFANKRILDFGCGGGASTTILSSLFPKAEIIGIDLFDDLLSIAKARAQYYGFQNVTFIQSPGGEDLPKDIGTFDFVVLSGVYEHMLPAERKQLLPRIWSIINPDGILFIDQTPYRFFPIESHTTGLPFINYLPDGMALAVSRQFSSRIGKNASWETLLRDGIRGGTVSEITNILRECGKPVVLEPNRLGFSDRIDLWSQTYGSMKNSKYSSLKQPVKFILKIVKLLTGIVAVPYLSLAIKKQE